MPVGWFQINLIIHSVEAHTNKEQITKILLPEKESR